MWRRTVLTLTFVSVAMRLSVQPWARWRSTRSWAAVRCVPQRQVDQRRPLPVGAPALRRQADAHLLAGQQLMLSETAAPAHRRVGPGDLRRSGLNTWHSGGLAGTHTYLCRRYDGVTYAAFFNHRQERDNEPDFGDIDPLLYGVANGITRWPSVDSAPFTSGCSVPAADSPSGLLILDTEPGARIIAHPLGSATRMLRPPSGRAARVSLPS